MTRGEVTQPRNRFLEVLDNAAHWSSLLFRWAAVLGIAAMILVTLVDVIGAKVPPLFGQTASPLRAGTELVYFSQVIAMAGALAYTKIEGGHIRLEFVDSLPGRVRNSFALIVAVLSLVLFIVLAWKGFEYGTTLRAHNDVTAAARIPIYPFVYWLALSCLPLCVVLLRDLVRSLYGVVKR